MIWYSYKGLEPHLQRAHAGHTHVVNGNGGRRPSFASLCESCAAVPPHLTFDKKMKPFRHLMLLLVAPALLGAEKDNQKTFYDNGNVRESFEMIARKDGKTGGMMKKFYPDGKLKSEMPIVEAGGELGYAPDGIVKTYYPNEKIESSVAWKGGKRNGPFEFYYNDGSLRERGDFVDDASKAVERFTRSHEKQGVEPCLVVDPEKSRVALPGAVVLHVDNYHDTGAHLGWVFGYRRVGEEWKEEVKQARGDTISSRETKDISVSTKDLTPGEWQFAVTSSVRGPEFFTEARSTKIVIEAAAPNGP